MSLTYEADIRRFLSTELGHDLGRLSSRDSLLEAGVLDSLGVMRTVAFLEKTYGITVDEDELMPEYFDTLESIAALVASKKAGAAGA